jgi:hypothetical protein
MATTNEPPPTDAGQMFRVCSPYLERRPACLFEFSNVGGWGEGETKVKIDGARVFSLESHTTPSHVATRETSKYF